MSDDSAIFSCEDLSQRVRERVSSCVADLGLASCRKNLPDLLRPGKMLRTRLAGRLVESGGCASSPEAVVDACAATELVHTASLCHDDVVDCAVIRRAQPTLWKASTSSAAVLIGDMLLCMAVEVVRETEGGRLLAPLVAKTREVCLAEVEQELVLRGRRTSEAACISVARRKTGPLFAFCASACGGADEGYCAALEEAGYRIGTAYQLADDWVDVACSEERAGKTLGTDAARRKRTLAHAAGRDGLPLFRHVADLCRAAGDCLSDWPSGREGVDRFLGLDVAPLFERLDERLGLCARMAI